MILKIEFGKSVCESSEILIPCEGPITHTAVFDITPQTPEGIEHLCMSNDNWKYLVLSFKSTMIVFSLVFSSM